MTKSIIKPLHKRRNNEITAEQKATRSTVCEILSIARRTGKPIGPLADEFRVSIETIYEHSHAIKKVGACWIVRPKDHVPREMIIPENGREVMIEVGDSVEASKVGRFYNVFGRYLEAEDPNRKEALLKEFKKIAEGGVTDIDGVHHILESDVDVIIEIVERKTEPEYPEPYPEGWR